MGDADTGAAEAASKPAIPEAVSVPPVLEEEAIGVAGVSGGSSFANLTLTAGRCMQQDGKGRGPCACSLAADDLKPVQ